MTDAALEPKWKLDQLRERITALEDKLRAASAAERRVTELQAHKEHLLHELAIRNGQVSAVTDRALRAEAQNERLREALRRNHDPNVHYFSDQFCEVCALIGSTEREASE